MDLHSFLSRHLLFAVHCADVELPSDVEIHAARSGCHPTDGHATSLLHPSNTRCDILSPLSLHPCSSPHHAELVELPADDPLSIFAAAVAAADVDDATQTITLGGGAQWRDMKSNVLYVRSFYADLWEAVLNKGHSVRNVLEGGAIILGTPGSE